MIHIVIHDNLTDAVIGRLAMRGWRYDEDFTAYYTAHWKLQGISILNPTVLTVLQKGLETEEGRVEVATTTCDNCDRYTTNLQERPQGDFCHICTEA